MSRSGGYKCYNARCGSCLGKTLCTEPGDTALSCQDRAVESKKVWTISENLEPEEVERKIWMDPFMGIKFFTTKEAAETALNKLKY